MEAGLEAARLMNLVDADVLVDCLRGTERAKAWLNELAEDSFAVPAAAAMELLMGCRDREDLKRIQKFLGMFAIVGPKRLNSRRPTICCWPTD